MPDEATIRIVLDDASASGRAPPLPSAPLPPVAAHVPPVTAEPSVFERRKPGDPITDQDAKELGEMFGIDIEPVAPPKTEIVAPTPIDPPEPVRGTVQPSPQQQPSPPVSTLRTEAEPEPEREYRRRSRAERADRFPDDERDDLDSEIERLRAEKDKANQLAKDFIRRTIATLTGIGPLYDTIVGTYDRIRELTKTAEAERIATARSVQKPIEPPVQAPAPESPKPPGPSQQGPAPVQPIQPPVTAQDIGSQPAQPQPQPSTTSATQPVTQDDDTEKPTQDDWEKAWADKWELKTEAPKPISLAIGAREPPAEPPAEPKPSDLPKAEPPPDKPKSEQPVSPTVVVTAAKAIEAATPAPTTTAAATATAAGAGEAAAAAAGMATAGKQATMLGTALATMSNPAVALGVALAGTTLSMMALNAIVDRTASSLTQYSGELSAASAENQIRKTMGDITRAEIIGDEAAEWQINMSRLMESANTTWTSILEIILKVANPMLKAAVLFGETIAPAIITIASLIAKLVELVTTAWDSYMKPVFEWFKKHSAVMGWLIEWAGDAAAKKDERKEDPLTRRITAFLEAGAGRGKGGDRGK